MGDDDEPIPEMVRLSRPRSLSSTERGLIEFLIEEPFGDDALRVQVRKAEVVAVCSCGCPSVLLGVDPTAPRSTATYQQGSPEELTAYQVRSRGLGAQLTLHIVEGVMYELEIWSHRQGVRPRLDPAKLTRIQEIDRRP